MKRGIAMRRLLAVLMIAGLALAPVSGPVMAEAPAHHASMQTPTGETSPSQLSTPDEMAEDMPCCPTKAPVPVDCDKCIFMAGCMSKCFAGMSTTVVHPFPVVSDRIALQRNDSRPDGLGHPPPEHPPRILV